METDVIMIRTGSRPTVRDITAEVERFLRARDARDGVLHIFVPHATAGIALIETGSGSDEDLLTALDQVLPGDDRWRHRHGSRGHGRDHVVPAFVAPYATVPVVDGRLALGTWQSVCLVDTNADNTTRQVRLSLLRG
ncbi:MAG TPA: secondary thiamine-phosphate synthase enzyme YjbQ [Micromonosporaceae bacterium]|jgi:secondary thiamine-phosphate synthase enzyme|nr:secondary thiamine-phosphate synthase enzyme YjbQ [Micromonosporaceae bacterium]